MNTHCQECESIELQYRKACFQLWANTSVGIREVWHVLRRLAGGDADDVVRLEELPRPKEIAEVLARRSEHRSFTGHHVNLPSPDPLNAN
jgi:hypothetical protein